MQNDILFTTFTPRECLRFSANLMLQCSPAERNEKVEEIIRDLKIEHCADTYVGGIFLKGISGGERKRTAIGVELITHPQVIFLDEPTSGLDSFTAYRITLLMKKFAKQGKTIIFTIHQPSSQIYFLFDRLILLVEGRKVYQGPARQCIDHFSSIGYKCPENSNPTDYFMSILNAHDILEVKQNAKFQNFFNQYNTAIAPQIQHEINQLAPGELPEFKHANSFGFETLQIAKRAWTKFTRDPQVIESRFAFVFYGSFLVGSMYFRLSKEMTLEAVFNKLGALFFICVASFMDALGSTSLTFPKEREVFLREENSKLYRVTSYFCGKFLVELPVMMIAPFLFCLIIYWIIGLNDDSWQRFAIFAMIQWLQTFNGLTLGIMCGSFFRDPKVTMAMTPVMLLPFMMFSGFYTNEALLPRWLYWIKYFSPFKYALEAMTWNEYWDYRDSPISPMSFAGFTQGMWPCIRNLACLGLLYLFLAFVMLKLMIKRLQQQRHRHTHTYTPMRNSYETRLAAIVNTLRQTILALANFYAVSLFIVYSK
eukprot:TRINITY_DN2181_c0_g1_i1.p1 TRINITY_DN2181_c0_g1~~TRINITY_DN2181_c0_g1_i1.p1  ORF type:complete len:538 (-),score=104.36 TRINITY_DN2181_c0_g1_i1:84-1697(-)